MKFHTVGINLGLVGNVPERPDMSSPPVTLDGRELHGVRSIKIEAEVESLTLVTIVLEAAVSGAVLSEVSGEVETLLRKPGPPDPGCHCKPGRCMAPVVMGRQTVCRDPSKRDMKV